MGSLNEYIAGKKPAGFQARPHYLAEGDCLIFYFKDDESFAERVDERLTVYRSMQTREIVGCQIKGVRYILEQLGNFGMCVQEGDIHLKVLIIAYALSAKRVPPSETLQELNEAAEKEHARLRTRDLVPA